MAQHTTNRRSQHSVAERLATKKAVSTATEASGNSGTPPIGSRHIDTEERGCTP